MAFYYDHTITPANLGSPAADVTNFVLKIFIANMNADFVAALRSDGMDLRGSLDGGVSYLDKDLVGFVQSPAAGYIALRIDLSHTNNTVVRFYGDGSTSYANTTGTYRASIAAEIPGYEASGNLLDRTVNGNNFVPAGTPTYGNAGLYGVAVGFDATTEYFAAADSASTSALETFAKMFWFAGADPAASSDFLEKRAVSNREYVHGYSSTAKLVTYKYDESVSKYEGRYGPEGTLFNGNPHFLSFESTAATAQQIWLDNAQVDNADDDSGSYVAIENKAAETILGANAGTYNKAIVGVYNHLRINNAALSASERTAIYTMMTNSATLGSKSGTTFPTAVGMPWLRLRKSMMFQNVI